MTKENNDEILVRLLELYEVVLNSSEEKLDFAIIFGIKEANKELSNLLDRMHDEYSGTLRTESRAFATKEDLEQIESELHEQLELLASAKQNCQSLAENEAAITERQKEIAIKVKALEMARTTAPDKTGKTDKCDIISDLEARIEQLRRKNEQVDLMAKKKGEIDEVCLDLQKQIQQKTKEKNKLAEQIKRQQASRQKLKQRFGKEIESKRSKICQQQVKLDRVETSNKLKLIRIKERESEFSLYFELPKLIKRLADHEDTAKQAVAKKVEDFNIQFNSDNTLQREYDKYFTEWLDMCMARADRMRASEALPSFTDQYQIKPSQIDIASHLSVVPVRDGILRTVNFPLLTRKINEFNSRFVKKPIQGQIVVKHCCLKMGRMQDWTLCSDQQDDDVKGVAGSIEELRGRINVTAQFKKTWHERYEYLIGYTARKIANIVLDNRPLVESVVKSLLMEVADDISRSCSFRSILRKMDIQVMKRPVANTPSSVRLSQSHLYVYHRPSSGGEDALASTPITCTPVKVKDPGELLALRTPIAYYSKRKRSKLTDQENEIPAENAPKRNDI